MAAHFQVTLAYLVVMFMMPVARKHRAVSQQGQVVPGCLRSLA